MTTSPSPRTVALGLAVTLALGTGTVAVAGAADGPSAAASTTAAKTAGPAKRAERKAAREEAFAKVLGVSTADVRRGALRAAKQDLTVAQLRDKRAGKVQKRLAKAVAKGRITQAQADAVVAAVRAGKPVKPALKQARAAQRKAHGAARKADRRAAEG
jgi:hypothetical protein